MPTPAFSPDVHWNKGNGNPSCNMGCFPMECRKAPLLREQERLGQEQVDMVFVCLFPSTHSFHIYKWRCGALLYPRPNGKQKMVIKGLKEWGRENAKLGSAILKMKQNSPPILVVNRDFTQKLCLQSSKVLLSSIGRKSFSS